jgi:Subtilase family
MRRRRVSSSRSRTARPQRSTPAPSRRWSERGGRNSGHRRPRRQRWSRQRRARARGEPRREIGRAGPGARAAGAASGRPVLPGVRVLEPRWRGLGMGITHTTQAWDVTEGDPAVVIAILDTGIKTTGLDDFNGQIASTWNALTKPTDVTTNAGNHGTYVAGVAGLAIANGAGGAGYCPKCKLMIVQVGSDSGAYLSDIASGLTYAADHGARVANMSWAGSSDSSTLQSAINYALGRVCPVDIPGVVSRRGCTSECHSSKDSCRRNHHDCDGPRVAAQGTFPSHGDLLIWSHATRGSSDSSSRVGQHAAASAGPQPLCRAASPPVLAAVDARFLSKTPYFGHRDYGKVHRYTRGRAMTFLIACNCSSNVHGDEFPHRTTYARRPPPTQARRETVARPLAPYGRDRTRRSSSACRSIRARNEAIGLGLPGSPDQPESEHRGLVAASLPVRTVSGEARSCAPACCGSSARANAR